MPAYSGKGTNLYIKVCRVCEVCLFSWAGGGIVYCTCKYYNNETCVTVTGKCCSHIIGQLRRTLYLTTRNLNYSSIDMDVSL